MNFSFNRTRQPVFCHFQIVRGLKIHPEAGARIEIPRQSQGSVRGDPAPLMHNLGNPCDRNSEIKRQSIHA